MKGALPRIITVIQRVSFPLLSQVSDDTNQQKIIFKKLLTLSFFISSTLMLGLAASAESFILALIGEKWRECIPYLQLLCFVGLFYTTQSLNLNILNVNGRSDIFLKLELIKKLFAIPIIFTGIFIGIIGGIGLGLLLGSEYSGRNITIIGAFLVVISLIAIVFLSYKNKK